MSQVDPKQIKQDGATTGQVLVWNGSEWAPGDASGEGGGAGVNPSVIHSNQETPAASGVDTASSVLADRAIFMPFHLVADATVKRIAIEGTGSSFDVGIYELDGTRLVSSGSTTGTGSPQIVDITDTALTAGRYYMAFANTSGSGTDMWAYADDTKPSQNLCGIKMQTSAFPLPASATLSDGGQSTQFPMMSLLLEA